jgi:hypothetical protein
MQLVRRLRSRNASEWLLILESAAMLVGTTTALRFCRFQPVRRLLMWYARITRPFVEHVAVEKIVHEIEAIKGRLRLEPTCLTIALTAEALLAQYGHDCVLCLGAKRNAGAFQAHAWIERNDSVVIGGPRELTREYTRFPRIPA